MTQRKRNEWLKVWRKSGFASQHTGVTPALPKTEDADRAGGEGFTLLELMCVLAVISVITVVALTSLKGGLFSEYAVSQAARKLTVSIQEARMRALQNEQVVKIKNVTGPVTEAWGNTYQVNFVKDANNKCEHGFQVNDYAAFTNLVYPMEWNGGAYLVTSSGADYIKLAFAGDVTTSGVSLGTALAKNITGASELVIRPRKLGDAGKSDMAQRGEFVYDSNRVVVWLEGQWTPKPGELPGGASSTNPASLPASYTVRFTSRGFTVDPQGDRILLTQRRSDGELYYKMVGSTIVAPYTPTHVLWVSVSPFGTVKTGRTDYEK
jgi:prepilin-type N-terminal cleavage/methylation domain-containing protein